jgi:Folate-dependent phosphoribosylglycinamide formyltransferase PurN
VVKVQTLPILLKLSIKKSVKSFFALTNNPQAEGITIAQENGIPYGVVEPKNFDSREAYDATVVETLNATLQT